MNMQHIDVMDLILSPSRDKIRTIIGVYVRMHGTDPINNRLTFDQIVKTTIYALDAFNIDSEVIKEYLREIFRLGIDVADKYRVPMIDVGNNIFNHKAIRNLGDLYNCVMIGSN